MDGDRCYLAIDLKSFYASVECVERGLDPLDACLVVADASRTEKTICLAVSPSLKAFGIGGRARLFEVNTRLRQVNTARTGRPSSARVSTSGRELAADPALGVGYLTARPRMGLYLEYSRRIYEIYLKWVSPADIHVYSVDEVIIDLTDYLSVYGKTAHQLAMNMIRQVLSETGITATAGIGTNMYLCKVAMDIVAKHIDADADGVRIAEIDEASYRRLLWEHTPITDFWRVGRGIAAKLSDYGMETMGDVARCSLQNEELLYRLFGVNAELLIDHAWGWEPVSMAEVKAYRPETRSISSGQVLQSPYPSDRARTVVREMTDAVALELVEKHLVTDQIVLEVGYDVESLSRPEIQSVYHGKVVKDRYGRPVPFHAHGTANMDRCTSSAKILTEKVLELYDRIINPALLVRRLTLSINRIEPEGAAAAVCDDGVQLDLFADYDQQQRRLADEREALERERRRQEAVLNIRHRFGKNAILKGTNFKDGATQRERNGQIGGHRE